MGRLELNELSGVVLREAIRVHRALGPGLLESTYERCLERALLKAGIEVAHQQPLDIVFDGERIENAYRVDLLVDRRLIVEIKSCEAFLRIHDAQLLTYLKLANLHLGLLLNFHVRRLVDGGIRRLVNGPPPRR